MTQAQSELLAAVGKLLLDKGEEWRMENVELVDAYNAVLEEVE